MNFDDTIVALSTPYGVGGIAVIRLSGPIAYRIITELFSKQPLTPRYVHHGTLKNPSTGDNIDEVCVVYFKGPQSFTGEDVVEIQCHSSINIIKNCLKICCDLGARIADAGEFTKRAFLNGKMDLTKAESVIDLIHSKSDYANTIALNRLQGGLYKRIQTLRQTLMKELEQIEGAIDFPDEVDPPDRTRFQKTISETCQTVKQFLDYKDYGKYIQSGVKCLILGYPNVGKSSLLNQLLGENRAIVTDTAGTTRDFIESTIEIGGLHFELIDTAGYRDTDNKIEAMGISKIESLLPEANAILWVVDQTRELNTIEHKLAEKIKRHSHNYLLTNKTDLDKSLLDTSIPLFENFQTIPISAKTGDGIAILKKALHSDFSQKANDIDADLICNIRQIQCLNTVYTNLTDLQTNLNQQFEYDILAIDLKQAILKLGEMTGEDITEEVLDGIFSRFCVGK